VARPPPDGRPGAGRTTPWPNRVAGHPLWAGRPPCLAFSSSFFWIFFFRKRKCDGGILGIKSSNWLNCHNLKVWGGLSVTLKTLEVKVKISGYFRGVKCNFSFIYLFLIYIYRYISFFRNFYYYYYYLC
jgi:hypothetical protein